MAPRQGASSRLIKLAGTASAAVADTLGETGNMEEATRGQLKSRLGTILAGGGAIALCWSAGTGEILAVACLLASSRSLR